MLRKGFLLKTINCTQWKRAVFHWYFAFLHSFCVDQQQQAVFTRNVCWKRNQVGTNTFISTKTKTKLCSAEPTSSFQDPSAGTNCICSKREITRKTSTATPNAWNQGKPKKNHLTWINSNLYAHHKINSLSQIGATMSNYF